MARAVPVLSGRGWKFLLWVLLCLLGGVKSSQAAGCHMQDRIMLRTTLSWEKELAVDLSAEPFVQLPPVLAEPPCRGDVPHVLDSDGDSDSCTASGKTECFLLPALLLPGLTVVVSPLKSLMQDQWVSATSVMAWGR